MSQFFDYSRYYNLLYKDKDYTGEVDYVHSLITRFHHKPGSLLDIGCGTGIHAALFAAKNLKVHGVDLSEEMLVEARKKQTASLTFSQGDATQFRLNKKFDVITSLFHVMSYQATNDAVAATFKTVTEHLNIDGIFIFDCWYGPGVMRDLPSVRVKRMENSDIRVLRVSEPVMDFGKSTVGVNFEVVVFDKQNNSAQSIREEHLMRYFFDNELHLFAAAAGLEIKALYGWLTTTAPTPSSWYVTVICARK